MPRKKSITPQMYGLIDSSRLTATPVEVVETGTVRLGLVLEIIATALEDYPEARLRLAEAFAARVGTNPLTRILP